MLFLRFLVLFSLMGTILFGAAGRASIPAFWAYLASMAVAAVLMRLAVGAELIRERLKPGPGGTDQAPRIASIPVMVAHLTLAGLDVGRFHWSDTVPAAVQAAGFVCMAASLGIWVWAMHTNRFFSSVIRIQRERGHRVITGGPYRFVRHPGYAASLPLYVASGLALGSWVSIVPVLAMIGFMLRRAALEDRVLLAELEGYREYAARVRFRLAPGLW
ncbi:MAG: methyltransferase family protein [Bryobacteraceae bacterium]